MKPLKIYTCTFSNIQTSVAEARAITEAISSHGSRKILILCRSAVHAAILTGLLRQKSMKAAMITGAMTESEVSAHVADFRADPAETACLALAGSFLAEAHPALQANTLVMAYECSPERISRAASLIMKSAEPVIVDLTGHIVERQIDKHLYRMRDEIVLAMTAEPEPRRNLKRIHINQHNIRANAAGANRPVMTCKTSRGNFIGNGVQIQGPSRLVYSPDKPLSCGARVWIETRAQVLVDGVDVDAVTVETKTENNTCQSAGQEEGVGY